MKRKLIELEAKYFSLVWLARKTEEDEERPEIEIEIDKVRTKYPKECADLANEEDGDWHHGFNSGMLAAVRAVLDPKADFPVLDT
jgi:hypothetical protein